MTTIPGVDEDLAEMMQGVLDKHAVRSDATRMTLNRELWRELDELGLARLTGSAESGGSEAGWLEAAELLSAAASAGVHIPFAESDLLAGALLEAAGLASDTQLRTVAVFDASGVAENVPWASNATSIVALWKSGEQWQIADVPVGDVQIASEGTNLVGEPRDHVVVSLAEVSATPIDAEAVEWYRLKGALVRAIQMCAALDRATAMSMDHVSTRKQFGRPLARFQAVQNLIADMAAESALARAATEAALDAAIRSEWAGEDLAFKIAVARSTAGHAASTVVRNAHQLHGAIGTAREHDLHRFTRAALAWRGEFGSVDFWDRQLIETARAAGSEGLWSLIAD